jgi:hypothetical protein
MIERFDFLRKIMEELEGEWTFQGGEKKGKDWHNTPREQPISSPFHTSKHSPRGEKRSDVFRTPSILLYFLRNLSPNQCGSLQSPNLASTHKRKRPPKGGTNTFHKPSPPQPSNWHPNHRGRERGLVLQTGHGRTDPTHAIELEENVLRHKLL